MSEIREPGNGLPLRKQIFPTHTASLDTACSRADRRQTASFYFFVQPKCTNVIYTISLKTEKKSFSPGHY